VKRLAAHVRARRAGHADGGEHPAVERAVTHGVVAVIGEPQGAVRRHVKPVRAVKDPLAPRAQDIALAVQHYHGVAPTVEGVHAILRVHAHRRHVGVELLPWR
jgi:hypothetical protein